MESLAARIIQAVVIGLLTGFLAFLIILVISMVLPGVSISASFWGGIIGLLAGLYAFLTRSRL